MPKTKTPNIKSTSVHSEYDTPLTTLEYLRKVQEQNAQVLARQDEIEEALNGKVAKEGDTMTGDLSVPNINVADSATIGNANVEKLTSSKLNQKYEGAIKAELHVDEEGITEFVNGSNAGRFDTARVIKPSEVKTEIYDNQQGKRMFFRLPYLEASAGEHRLLTEEDLGGGGSSLLEDIEDADGHKRFFNLNGAKGADTDTYFDTFSAVASLSGYHLMIVLLMTKKNEHNVDAEKEIAVFDIPSWIYDKIISLSTDGIIMRNNVSIYTNGVSLTTQYYLKKENGQLKVITGTRDSMNSYTYVRAQFDLYIK